MEGTPERRCAVALTFDFDAESAWLDPKTGLGEPGMISRGQYGANEGLPRILRLLSIYALPATFFVPGYTGDHYPTQIEQILAAGHELGHHGYLHKSPLSLDEAEKRRMLERGIDSLQRIAGKNPIGYRAPGWEIGARTIPLLLEYGFQYDDSLFSWDRPYWLEHEGQRTTLVEIPSDWSLADSAHFLFLGNPYMTGLADPRAVEYMWQEEFSGIYEEGGCLVLTMHPQIIGRHHRLRILERLIQHMLGRPGVWFARVGEIDSAFRAAEAG